MNDLGDVTISRTNHSKNSSKYKEGFVSELQERKGYSSP